MERMIKTGRIVPKHASKIKCSRIGIGFEKLDRNAFDPEKAYDKVAAIGAKWVRIQSGWARTETEKGIYHFEWLDRIVDNLISRGLKPWLCLCYGNALYTRAARESFGAVGFPPILTAAERYAWECYVSATADHFKDRVQYFEIWNEPDWLWRCGRDENEKSFEWLLQNARNPAEYGNFAIATSQAVKKTHPHARMIGGAICQKDLRFLDTAFRTGMADSIDAISFHDHTNNEMPLFELIPALRALGRTYNPGLEIIQGESGAPSRSDGCGGDMVKGAWTPKKQAKMLLRHIMSDILCGVMFTSYFSTMDMLEGLMGNIRDKKSYQDYGYFGVLAADFDENGIATGEYTPKPSYYALQNLCSLFAEEYEVVDLPIWFLPRKSVPRLGGAGDFIGPTLIRGGFRREDGSCAFVCWNSSELLTTEFESTTTIQAAALPNDIRLVDPMDGSIYRFPDSMIDDEGNGQVLIKNFPIRDYPLVITFGDFLK